jgi:hypothetical protein
MQAALRRDRLWRAHELLGSVPVALWACVHLYEQWSAFASRDAWAERMAKSAGSLGLASELAIVIVPALAWIGLELYLRLTGPEPDALRSALAERPEAARRLGALARVSSWLFFGWLLYHAGWLWLPKLLDGTEPLRTWVTLTSGLGTLPHAILHAVGLTVLVVHLTAAVPRFVIAFELVARAEGRRAARLSGLIVSLGIFLLYAQLAGWHAAGRGTIWSLGE